MSFLQLLLKNRISAIRSEANRSVRASVLFASIHAFISLRKLCIILVLLVFSTTLFTFSSLQVYFEIVKEGNINKIVWAFAATAAIGLLLTLYLLSERFWVRILEINKQIKRSIGESKL